LGSNLKEKMVQTVKKTHMLMPIRNFSALVVLVHKERGR
jgi:hypothetical protein